MGLDMYLTKKTYIGAEYEHRNIKGQIALTEGKDNKPIPIKLNRVSYIEGNVGYWRKANHIHKWIIDNCQEGNDDCREADFPKKKVLELLALCKEVKKKVKLIDGAVTNGKRLEGGVWVPIVEEGKEVKNQKVAHELLPRQSGFFFGGTDYDQYYMQDVDDTIEILEAILIEGGEGEYFPFDLTYQASW